MGEWKRVFMNMKRIGTALTMVFLCSLLFLLSLIPQIGPGELKLSREAAKYTESLYEKWKDVDISEIGKLQEDESMRIMNYASWYNRIRFVKYPYDNSKDADLSVSDIPYLIENHKNREWLFRISGAFSECISSVSEQAAYTAGYEEYLNKIQKQAEEQSKTSVFGNPDSFSMRNLKKTAREFEYLQDHQVRAVFGNNLSLQKWLSFKTSDFFQLLFMIIIVMSFLEERKKGLWSVIRTTKGGRVRLGLCRILIIFTASVISAFLFTFLNFFVSELFLGKTDLSRSIQSVEEFRTCTYDITIIQWMGLYFLMKVLSGFTVGMIIWAVLGSVTNIQFSLGILIISLAGEYALYRFLPVQSIFNGLKYLNLFSLIHVSDFFTKYLNINFFGYPVGNKELIYMMMGVFAVSCTVFSVMIQKGRFPEGNRDIFGKLTVKLNALLDMVRIKLSPFWWEVYKHLFFQYGIVLLVMFFLISGNLSFRSYRPMTEYERTCYMYVTDIEGKITRKTDRYIGKAMESAGKSQNSGLLFSAIMGLQNTVMENRERASEKGYTPWIVDDRVYDEFFGSAAKNNQRLNATVVLLFIVFLISGIGSFENQAGVVPMLRSLKSGRKGVFYRKVLLAVLMTLYAFLTVYMREITEFSALHVKTLSAPVQNIRALSEFPVIMSFRTYLTVLYTLKFLSMLFTSFGALFISSFCKSIRMSYLLNTAVFCFPALLTVLGAEYFKVLSPVVAIASSEILWGCKYLIEPVLIYLIVFDLGLMALMGYSTRWSGDK